MHIRNCSVGGKTMGAIESLRVAPMIIERKLQLATRRCQSILLHRAEYEVYRRQEQYKGHSEFKDWGRHGSQLGVSTFDGLNHI
jgi:hypothetical protein